MDSVELAIFNRTKRKMFDTNTKFTNVADYLVFVMEIVEEYSYMLSPEEKRINVIRVAKRLGMVPMIDIDDTLLAAIIRNVCVASKQQLDINKRKKISFFMRCLKQE